MSWVPGLQVVLASVAVGRFGFRWCGLFGVPLVWAVWGSVGVGRTGITSAKQLAHVPGPGPLEDEQIGHLSRSWRHWPDNSWDRAT